MKVTFVLPPDQPHGRVSVVGDFNDWDPHSAPLRRRSNRKFSAAVELPAGERFRFRYLGEDGTWFNEEDADGFEPTEYGSWNSILRT